MTITPDRLAELDQITLDHGSHADFTEGHCAMEVVSWLAGEGFTDAPACASPVLRRYMIALNDRWDDERRQTLKPYLVRMIGTGDDGKDQLREQVALRFLLGRLLEPWFRLAGMNAEADEVAGTIDLSRGEQIAAIRRWRDAAWALRDQRRDSLQTKIEAEVKKRLEENPGAAGAAGADGADEAAGAAWAAGAAGQDLSYGTDAYWRLRQTAYEAARKHYAEQPPPVMAEIAELAANQRVLALELLDLLIDPTDTAEVPA